MSDTLTLKQRIINLDNYINNNFSNSDSQQHVNKYDELQKVYEDAVQLKNDILYSFSPSEAMNLSAPLDESNKSLLKEFGPLKEEIKAHKKTLIAAKNELSLAESREKAIKNRDIETSNQQVFGHIFRPFRQLSYVIIVPIIFLMVVMAGWIIWSATPVKFTISKSVSAPTNNLNALLKQLQ